MQNEESCKSTELKRWIVAEIRWNNNTASLSLVTRLVSSLTSLGGIALAAQALPPIPTHFYAAWSVCLSSVCHIRAPCLNR